jgi:hypothetical protein
MHDEFQRRKGPGLGVYLADLLKAFVLLVIKYDFCNLIKTMQKIGSDFLIDGYFFPP